MAESDHHRITRVDSTPADARCSCAYSLVALHWSLFRFIYLMLACVPLYGHYFYDSSNYQWLACL
jgi:hypothetical protein